MSTRIIDETDVSRWDHRVDVLVVGLGCAGACAAIDAARHGANTMVLERASAGGGTSAMSGGVLYCGGGTDLQKQCGFADTAEDMRKYLLASNGIAPDVAKTDIFCERSVEHFNWVVALGVPFKPSFWPHNFEPWTDDGLYYSGLEFTEPFASIARPAPRGHCTQGVGSCAGGPVLMRYLIDGVAKAGASIVPDADCQQLVRSRAGEILGVAARIDGERKYIRAAGGVILATGGFILNREMAERYAPHAARATPLASTWDDGRGILLGQAAGGDCINMQAALYGCPFLVPFELEKGVLVNSYGQRFIAEDTNHKRIGETAMLRYDGKMYVVVDNSMFQRPAYEGVHLVATGDTIAEVEQELGMPQHALQSTIETYNFHAEKGSDPLFGKRPEMLRPLNSPPFGVFECDIAKGGPYKSFTLGGLRTLPTGEVLSVEGEAIPGLYAAGRTTSALSAQTCGSSGLQLGDGTFFGRLAGLAAAKRH
jgi:succinate dehydrogenase/fumarate reductase flavoprotein subunit